MRETWYVLEDGTAVDPIEVAPGEAGKLRHKSGAAVAMRGQVPSSRGVDPEEERAKVKAKAVKPAAETKDMKPAPAGTYQTRGAKAG